MRHLPFSFFLPKLTETCSVVLDYFLFLHSHSVAILFCVTVNQYTFYELLFLLL